MIVLFLLLVIAAMALGVLGIVVHGLLYLLLPASACSSSPFSSAPCGCDGEPPKDIAFGEGASGVACAARESRWEPLTQTTPGSGG
jgi:hypothetical protein